MQELVRRKTPFPAWRNKRGEHCLDWLASYLFDWYAFDAPRQKTCLDILQLFQTAGFEREFPEGFLPRLAREAAAFAAAAEQSATGNGSGNGIPSGGGGVGTGNAVQFQ